MRLTVMALAQGGQQHEHEPRGEATLQVLHGRARVLADGESWDAGTGDLQLPALSIVTGRTNTLGSTSHDHLQDQLLETVRRPASSRSITPADDA